jgi:hypothetical protein
MGVAQTYPLRVAAEAAQLPETKTPRRWQDNRVITLGGNGATANGTGNRCGWSRNRILQLAITQALVKRGVSLSMSAKAALEFSDNGGASRAAGQLYPVGKTILRLGSKDAEVANVDFSASIFDLSNDSVTICIDLNRIVEQVDSVLNKFKH